MSSDFSTNLRRIRKEKKITQEQLAEAVGVSPQAVSKWEISSFPDAQLLPGIADFLGVTIDELFGRAPEKEITMEQRVLEYFNGIPREERLHKAFYLFLSLTQSCCGCPEYMSLPDSIANVSETDDWESFSEVTWKNGYAQARLNGNLQYFLLMPEPKCGYDFILAYDPEMVKLFEFLAKPDALKVMYYLAGRESTMFFNAEALVKELGISREKAGQLIGDMLEMNFIWEADLNNGSSGGKIYQYLADCNFVSFINFTRILLNRPYSYSYQTGDNEYNYFKKDTYKKKADDKNEK